MEKTRELALPLAQRLFQTNLIRMRNALNLTQAELGELAGVTPGTYQKYEYATTFPSAQTISALAVALKSPIHELFIDMNKAAPTVAQMTPDQLLATFRASQLAPDETELLGLFQAASPAMKRAILETVRKLLKTK